MKKIGKCGNTGRLRAIDPECKYSPFPNLPFEVCRLLQVLKKSLQKILGIVILFKNEWVTIEVMESRRRFCLNQQLN